MKELLDKAVCGNSTLPTGDEFPGGTRKVFTRRLLLASAGAAIFGANTANAQSESPGALLSQLSFADLLAQLSGDPDLTERSWAYRDPQVSRGVPTGKPSKRKLNQSASDLIINCEISSPKAYEARYRRPIWPKGESGVTVGVGYDLKFANRDAIERDWPQLSKADRDLLLKVIHFYGEKARDALPLVSSVDIPWEQAKAQFFAFLPYQANIAETSFSNCQLLSDDSFGALVSLVYNRGASGDRNSARRREMYDIHQLMASKQFSLIPERILSMRRLWTTPDSKGLILRREAEAALFQRGLPPKT